MLNNCLKKSKISTKTEVIKSEALRLEIAKTGSSIKNLKNNIKSKIRQLNNNSKQI